MDELFKKRVFSNVNCKMAEVKKQSNARVAMFK